jgi:biopolymer transport protein ExbB
MTTFAEYGLLKFFIQGGFFMWPLLIVSILVATISVERYLAYRYRLGIDGRQLFNQLKKYLTASDYHRALETCRQYALVPLAQVLGAGIANADQPKEEMETAMEAEALLYVPKIQDRLGYLSTLANISTLLGLLGTISGLIASFASVGGLQESGVSRNTALAGGISVAMYTTAFGLIIAIPTLLIHNYLANRANRLIDDIQHYSTELKKFVQRNKSGTPVKFKNVG